MTLPAVFEIFCNPLKSYKYQIVSDLRHSILQYSAYFCVAREVKAVLEAKLPKNRSPGVIRKLAPGLVSSSVTKERRQELLRLTLLFDKGMTVSSPVHSWSSEEHDVLRQMFVSGAMDKAIALVDEKAHLAVATVESWPAVARVLQTRRVQQEQARVSEVLLRLEAKREAVAVFGEPRALSDTSDDEDSRAKRRAAEQELFRGFAEKHSQDFKAAAAGVVDKALVTATESVERHRRWRSEQAWARPESVRST